MEAPQNEKGMRWAFGVGHFSPCEYAEETENALFPVGIRIIGGVVEQWAFFF